jgi:hypothetical protein
MMSDGVVHLAQHHKYDEDEMWCGKMPWPGEQTREINEATCVECLDAAIAYGFECAKRVQVLNALKHGGFSL